MLLNLEMKKKKNDLIGFKPPHDLAVVTNKTTCKFITLELFKSQHLSLHKSMNHISHIVIISHSRENVLPQNVKETLENAVF